MASLSLEIAKRVLRQETEALNGLAQQLGQDFETAVEAILACNGRVVCCGVGKSGHIANKTAATLASTGTPAFFLHAAEAVHGDLGMVTHHDVVLVYTHSGETDEIVRLYPSFKAAGAKTITITGRPLSTVGSLSDIVLDTGVRTEACPNNLAPTTSTTVMLALSDALAITAMERKGFGKEDFARFHPAGSLGKRLLLRVEDVMRSISEIAVVSDQTPAIEVMREIATAGVGAACVLNTEHELKGFVTEGDLRRHLLKSPIEVMAPAKEFMTVSPATLESDLLAIDALEIFQNFPSKIGEMPVVSQGKVVGLLMLKDLLRCGII
jgi:arabinose-5-phosphate isomerase